MEIDFDKMGGLVPAIVQDAATGEVLMLGFMNRAAYESTLENGYVTFFSRTRNQLQSASVRGAGEAATRDEAGDLAPCEDGRGKVRPSARDWRGGCKYPSRADNHGTKCTTQAPRFPRA